MMSHCRKPLTLFVHRASECLTDHESHGDGLICFSLLNGLAERGHQIYAYTDTALIHQCSPNLHLKISRHRVPANSLAPWEQTWRAGRWQDTVAREQPIDLVWRMHPYGGGCPAVPRTGGRPLVVGPLFYDWPAQAGRGPKAGRPRLGIGLQRLLRPIAERGWQHTLQQAALILCATGAHTRQVQQQHPDTAVIEMPVIVSPTPDRANRARGKRVTLLFAGNLVPSKNPMLFCETIDCLRASGLEATGIVLGDGPERVSLEAECARRGLSSAIVFQGKVANSDVYSYLSKADFLVSASFGEPYGRGIAEAMSVGTPAVCHRSGGPADFISDGQNGLLVKELTAAAFAERIVGTLSRPGAWTTLSENARHTAKAWSSAAVLPRLEEALYDAMQNGPRQRSSRLSSQYGEI